MSALLPCPFCGGRNPGLWHQDVGVKSFPRVNCGACGSGTGFSPKWSDDDAIAAWNQRATPAEVEKLRADVERLKSAASTINDEVCQTLGKVLGYPWFKDDPGNFPDSTEAHGVCVGDHVAESIAAEAAERIETLRAEVSEWCQKTQLFEDIVHRRKNERDAIAIAFTKLSAVLRVNMLRHVPGTSHAEIDAAIDACLGPIARAALAKEPGNEG